MVSAQWVAEQMRTGLPGLLLDARSPDAYAAKHLVGAVNLDAETTWKDRPPEPLMLDVSDMGALMSAHGISFTGPVFIYDDGKYLNAARLFWVLEAHGHPDVHIIEGGMQRWELLDYPLETQSNAPSVSKPFVPVVQANRLATTEDVYRSTCQMSQSSMLARPRNG